MQIKARFHPDSMLFFLSQEVNDQNTPHICSQSALSDKFSRVKKFAHPSSSLYPLMKFANNMFCSRYMDVGLVISAVHLQREIPGSHSNWDLSVWGFNVLPMHAWVFSRHSGFLPQFKNMLHGMICISQLQVYVSFECVTLTCCSSGPVRCVP